MKPFKFSEPLPSVREPLPEITPAAMRSDPLFIVRPLAPKLSVVSAEELRLETLRFLRSPTVAELPTSSRAVRSAFRRAAPPLTLTVPAVTAPSNLRLPEVDSNVFVAPNAMVPPTVRVPLTERFAALLLIAPVVREPARTDSLESPASVTKPVSALLPPMFTTAPCPWVPERVIALSNVISALRPKAPPAETVTPPSESAWLPVATNLPSVMVVVPAKSLLPDKVRVPAPSFVSEMPPVRLPVNTESDPSAPTPRLERVPELTTPSPVSLSSV